MKKIHNFSIDIKMTKNVEAQVVKSFQINFSTTFKNNQMNYTNLPNHDNLNMI